MPITYRIDGARKLVLAKAEGVLTTAQFVAYVELVLADRGIGPGFNELIDLREVAELEVSERGFGEVVKAIMEVEPEVKETKTALVASNRDPRDVSRFCTLLRVSVPATVELFHELAAARAWLGVADDGSESAGEQRAEPRKSVCAGVVYRSGKQEEGAEVVNISLSGALLKCAAPPPDEGTIVEVRFDSPETGTTIEVNAQVIRHTEPGFAIHFSEVTTGLIRLVRDLSSLSAF